MGRGGGGGGVVAAPRQASQWRSISREDGLHLDTMMRRVGVRSGWAKLFDEWTTIGSEI